MAVALQGAIQNLQNGHLELDVCTTLWVRAHEYACVDSSQPFCYPARASTIDLSGGMPKRPRTVNFRISAEGKICSVNFRIITASHRRASSRCSFATELEILT